ncbi:MAG: GGDEF domain-containing protein [Lachnospiraceae bacterium]
MRFLKIHQVQIVLVIFFVVTIIGFHGEKKSNQEKGYIEYNNDWECIMQDTTKLYQKLPQKIDLSEGEKSIVLTKKLDQKIVSVESLGFFTQHQIVEAYLDGTLLYSCKVQEGSMSKTPGKLWNFIQIPRDYAGKTIEIHLTNCYNEDILRLPNFLYGPQATILIKQIREGVPGMIIGIVMLVIGIFIIIAWYGVREKLCLRKELLWFGLFTLQLSVWSSLETQVLPILFGRPLLFGEIAMISMKLMILPLIRFLQTICCTEDSKALNFLCMANVFDVCFSFIGQIFGWINYEQGIWITYATILAAVLIIFAIGIKRLLKKESREKQPAQTILFHTLGVGGIIVCILGDTLNYYYGFHSDLAACARIGWLIYISFLIIHLIRNAIELMQTVSQVEDIKEQAELDGLTRLKNRSCFDEEISHILSHDFKKYALVMFDLNNMKKMNDLYGHSMGDCYIIISSEIIRDMFWECGELYRIGGDEFCLLSDCLTEEEYEMKEAKMCEWVASLQGAQVKDFMQIASGYAKFNPNRDINLQDTLEHADSQMYRRKKVQKA